MHTKVLLSVLVLFSLLASCNMPAGQTPATQPPGKDPVSLDENAIATAVELTAAAKFTEMAASVVPETPLSTATAIPTATSTPTTAPVAGPCSPLVTATVNANVRSGPDTAYDIVGALTVGQTATIVGRNDAYTWWYIDYPGVAGNHAWVAGTVVSSACVPTVVQVVAAPPLPTPTTVEVADNSGNQGGNSLLPLLPLNPGIVKLALPDLVVVSMEVSPSPATKGEAVSVKVKVKNTGKADAGSFKVQWWASSSEVGCSWSVASLAVGASTTRSCSYTYAGASGSGGNTIELVVDSGSTVSESDENNNTSVSNLVVLLDLQFNPNIIKPIKPIKPIIPVGP